MNEIQFIINKPANFSGKFITGKASVRTTKKGFAYMKRSQFEKECKRIFKQNTPENWAKDGVFYVSILCYFEIEKNSTKKETEQKSGSFYTKKPDADNIAKGVQDALTEIVFNDDNQVAVLNVEKYYHCLKDEQASVIVTVKRLDDIQ